MTIHTVKPKYLLLVRLNFLTLRHDKHFKIKELQSRWRFIRVHNCRASLLYITDQRKFLAEREITNYSKTTRVFIFHGNHILTKKQCPVAKNVTGLPYQMQHQLHVYHFNETKRIICASTSVNKKMASNKLGIIENTSTSTKILKAICVSLKQQLNAICNLKKEFTLFFETFNLNLI